MGQSVLLIPDVGVRSLFQQDIVNNGPVILYGNMQGCSPPCINSIDGKVIIDTRGEILFAPGIGRDMQEETGLGHSNGLQGGYRTAIKP